MINQSSNPNITISSDNDVKQQLDSYISSNVLCNYMREPEFLKVAIKTMRFCPRYLLAHVQVEKVVVDKDRKGSEIYISNIKEDPWKLVRKFSKTIEQANKIQTELFNKYSEKSSKDNTSEKIK